MKAYLIIWSLGSVLLARPALAQPPPPIITYGTGCHWTPSGNTATCTDILNRLVQFEHSNADPNTIRIDRTTWDLQPDIDGNTYFIVLASRPATLSPFSPGHAFVALGKEDNQKNVSITESYGFYEDNPDPSQSASFGKALFAGVPGDLLNEAKGDYLNLNPAPFSDAKIANSMVFVVDRDAFDAAENFVDQFSTFEKYNETPGDYQYVKNDCATFVINTAAAAGIDLPPRSIADPASWFPNSYINNAIHDLSADQQVTLSDGTTYVGQMLDGSPNGEGVDYGDGKVLYGNFNNGVLTQGTVVTPDEAITTTFGLFGVESGSAHVETKEGSTIDGQWNDTGTSLTSATYRWEDGTIYMGDLSQQGAVGPATMKFPNGSTFSGVFGQNGKAISGKLTTADGAVFNGSLGPNGELQNGTIVLPGGESFQGNFALNGQLSSGTLFIPNESGLRFKDRVYNGSFSPDGSFNVGTLTYNVPGGDLPPLQMSFTGSFSGNCPNNGYFEFINGAYAGTKVQVDGGVPNGGLGGAPMPILPPGPVIPIQPGPVNVPIVSF